ncbi:MAG: hypothetical protein RLZZ241_2013 [Bacteroidota bacterium]
MQSMQVGWFEIPVLDLDRAKLFYETVFRINIQVVDFGPLRMGMFPAVNNQSHAPGALAYHPQYYIPSNPNGVLIYLSCTDVAACLLRAGASGGKVLQEMRQISKEFGFTGVFQDTEGNRIALRGLQAPSD